jgi:hypothetical protein
VKLPPEWREFIASLCSHRVRFLIVGAHALAANGRPRATQDLDVFVEPTAENAQRLGRALAEIGFRELASEADWFTVPDRLVVLGREPLRIDVMTSITGVSFARAWAGRRRVRMGFRLVGFLGRAELVRNKKLAGRPKDLLDLALLAETAGPRRLSAASPGGVESRRRAARARAAARIPPGGRSRKR